MVTSKRQRPSIDNDDDGWSSSTTNKRFKRNDKMFPSLWSVVLGVEKSQEIDRVVDTVQKALPARKKTAKEIAHFFLYCYERQKIWERIRRGSKEPFTQSAVLRNYSFCNVRGGQEQAHTQVAVFLFVSQYHAHSHTAACIVVSFSLTIELS